MPEISGYPNDFGTGSMKNQTWFPPLLFILTVTGMRLSISKFLHLFKSQVENNIQHMKYLGI